MKRIYRDSFRGLLVIAALVGADVVVPGGALQASEGGVTEDAVDDSPETGAGMTEAAMPDMPEAGGGTVEEMPADHPEEGGGITEAPVVDMPEAGGGVTETAGSDSAGTYDDIYMKNRAKLTGSPR